MVFNLLSVMAALVDISVFIINEVDKLPDASLCTIPAVLNPSIETVPLDEILSCSTPLVLNDKLPEFEESPAEELPVNVKDGAAVVPAGNIKVPVIVSPDLSTFNDAAPVIVAVILFATKLPELSRATIALGVLALVAVVAELATFPAVLIVFNLLSVIPALAEISLFTINELVNNPVELLCTTPAVVNPSRVKPDELKFICSVPAISKERTSAIVAVIPVPVLLPVNSSDGAATVPAGNTKVPVRVPPVRGKSNDACPVTLPVTLPVKFALMVPAEKLPEESRATIVFAVFKLVAVVAELATFPDVEIVANLLSVIPAPEAISLFIINEVDKLPDASLCTTPAVVNPSIEIVPLEEIFICSVPLVLNDKFPELAERPLVVLPENINDGDAVVPAGSCNVPVKVPPDKARSWDACPVTLPIKLAVTVPAEKLPDPSRTTISFATLELEIFANLSLVIVAVVISPSTISELDNNPVLLL
jgi:hypothetical protein